MVKVEKFFFDEFAVFQDFLDESVETGCAKSISLLSLLSVLFVLLHDIAFLPVLPQMPHEVSLDHGLRFPISNH